LKKIPPIPVTFFIFVNLYLLEMIELKAKPIRNEVAINAVVNMIRFMVYKIKYFLFYH
jgi:hypothetical protein